MDSLQASGNNLRHIRLFWTPSQDPNVTGYVIYRSTSPDFSDQQTITDVNGNAFLFQPLKNDHGVDARFDLVDEYQGPSKTPFRGRGVSYYLGDNTGLVHMYVDSNNVINGQTYYYAVCSYDHGLDSLNITPTECSKIITFDPTTNEYKFDVNTAKVVPRSRPAGYIPAQVQNGEDNGGVIPEPGTVATGKFDIKIVDDKKVEDNNRFLISFSDSTGQKTYSVEDLKPKQETFVSFYGQYVALQYNHLDPASICVFNLDSSVVYEDSVDYIVDPLRGSILVLDPKDHPGARMEDATEYRVSYTNYPIYHSTALHGELTNPYFDGIQLSITETPFKLRTENTGWSASSKTTLEYELVPNKASHDPVDYLFTFYDTVVDTSMQLFTFYPVRTNFKIMDVDRNRPARFIVFDKVKKDSIWEPGEPIFLLNAGDKIEKSWTVTFKYPASGDTVLPGAGDAFYISVFKPFRVTDKFSFTTKAAHIDPLKAKSDLDKIRVVPNPYVATNIIEPKNFINRAKRGYRRLYFDKLPRKCTIKIFTTAGELVRVLHHDSAIDDGKEFWDLLSKDNMEVSYGLYFYHVEAPGIGEKIGKFVIIK
ncbi:hypothetical protein DRI50_01390 [candidate division KSB1 bacterium]|nr:MAG: hypothetical protein DRI50_01390 [candidate division KSB1 bacterium]